MRPFTLLMMLLFPIALLAQEYNGAGTKESVGAIGKSKVKFDVSVLKGKIVTFPSAGGNGSGYLSLPADRPAGKHPAVILIHEWWGLNEWIEQDTDRFAGNGYVSLAVDLYRGKVTRDPTEAHELMRGLAEDRAIADLKAGIDYLLTRTEVDPKQIAVIGWCMGGGFSLDLSLVDPRVTATVINYGHLVTDPATINGVHAPILGNFGADDRGITVADVETFRAALARAGKPADIKIYPGAGHGFMNPNNKQSYVPAAADDAWRRIDLFLSKQLNR